MQKDRRIIYKLVHKDMNKTGLAESISYGDFIPELENRRHLYVKTKYGEDLVIKDEQVLTLEKLSENFIQLGKSGDKNVELSLMFLTKWKNHTDHYTLDGEISFDKLWEGVRPAEFIPYIYSTKPNKNMTEFASDLSVFTYDEDESDSANLITLHEKLRLLAQHYKNAYKHVTDIVIEVYKKFFGIREYTHSKGPKEVWLYGNELYKLGSVLLEASKIIRQGETRDFSGLLDKLEELELFPKSQIVDLTQHRQTEKIKIKLLSDNKSAVVNTTNIYIMDTAADAIDMCTVYHNRYGDIINGFKPSTPEVKANGTGNNSITFEEDGCIYLKGGYKYLVRSSAIDLYVLKYDPVPITHYPLYRNTEFSGVKSYQAGTVLIGSRGTPFIINTPIFNYDALKDTASYQGDNDFTVMHTDTNIREILQLYGEFDRDVYKHNSNHDYSDYKPMYFPLLELSRAVDTPKNVKYPNTQNSQEKFHMNFIELGNKTGGDFVSRWYHGLVQKDSLINENGTYSSYLGEGGDFDNINDDTQFFFPQPTKVSDIKVTSISTDIEYSYQNEINQREDKMAKFLGFGVNSVDIFNQYYTDYNYGQGARLRLIYTMMTYAGARRDKSYHRMYNQSVPFKNSVVSGVFNKNHDKPKYFNNGYADPYTYRTYDKYYLDFRSTKPGYPTLKFTSLKDGSVKYLAKRWNAPRVYTHGTRQPNSITIQRDITYYIVTEGDRCKLEVRVYNRDFPGKEPDDTYYSGGLFSSDDLRGNMYTENYRKSLHNLFIQINEINNIGAINVPSGASITICDTQLRNIEQGVSLQDYLGNYKSGVFQNARKGDKYTVFMRFTEGIKGTNPSNWIKIPFYFTQDDQQ